MAIELKRLARSTHAFSQAHPERWVGLFVALNNALHINAKWRNSALRRPLFAINQAVWNLQTIVLRLDWQRAKSLTGELSGGLWRVFAACDIDQFHVSLRSLFDHVASAISKVADRQGQVPADSFEALANWVHRSEGNKWRLGADLAEIVNGCGWFKDVRRIRNSIVHKGHLTLVFPPDEGIWFQVYAGVRDQIDFPEVMPRPKLVDFELYAGVLMGYLFEMLEDLAATVILREHFEHEPMNGWSEHTGFAITTTWIGKAITAARAA